MLALGPGQVGKSSFLSRLLQQPPPKCSTGVAESIETCINYTSKTAALGEGNDWHCLKDLTSQVDVLVHLVCDKSKPSPGERKENLINPSKPTEVQLSSLSDSDNNNTPPTVEDKVNSSSFSESYQDRPSGHHSDVVPSDKTETISSTKHEQTVSSSSCELDIAQINTEKKEIETVVYKEFDRLLDKLDTDQIITDTLCNVVDVGGQPAFLDMLPLLTIGPAMYLIFTKLVHELTEDYPVMFRSKDSSESHACANYSYTTEEVIFSALSSISCFGMLDNEFLQNNMLIETDHDDETVGSLALLMGTFKDEYDKDENVQLRVKEEECKLLKKLKNTGFTDTQIEFEDRSDGRVFFRVNNKSIGTDEIKAHRKCLENMINKKFSKYKIPVKWLKLSICLKLFANKKGTPFMRLENCTKLGEHLDMSQKDVEAALTFFHRYIGLLMYFPQKKGLKNLVICDPQIVFLSISELIFKVYGSNNQIIPNDQYDRFLNSGQFSLNAINKMPDTVEGKKLLPVQELVDLLVQLNIAVPILSSSEYFFPAVLKNLKRSEITCGTESVIEPLYILFEAGCLPLGFVSALIANLIAREQLTLLDDIIYKNQINMKFKNELNITLLSCPKYCKVCVTSDTISDSDNLIDLKEILCKAANDVVDAMQHSSFFNLFKKYYDVGFNCPKCYKEDSFGNENLAIVKLFSNKMLLECKNSGCKCKSKLTEAMSVWYCKVSTMNDKLGELALLIKTLGEKWLSRDTLIVL